MPTKSRTASSAALGIRTATTSSNRNNRAKFGASRASVYPITRQAKQLG
ncbi:hypothetical protein I546_3910 [Mycobacterium kansasii 732]|nr:hypothetical protein I546_3910 [Mycobacterium kansasii 732]